MIKMKSALLAAALTSMSGWAAAHDPLSVADVERLTGHKGLKVVASRLPVDREFQTPQGDTVLLLRVDQADRYAMWKQAAGKKARALPAVGDEAFVGDMGLAFVCLRKKAQGICVTPGYAKGRAVLSEPQLIELAKAAAAKV
ncbi:MAG: hypothetical protein ACOZD0_10475 [Pseudomonadota bacterium]